ncbi:hypothetical protein PUNSTDRAFT_100714 [Punctularia strigosozonata HHB-11173 SS5]|uniref:uncharacterized protein n=1 Tax=Punctularia strigosozonata (strain HHB-11173) TaxID=741275 RepID=UPI0004417071|nr:uncharacterized protein PUNSTDRAFT_100714 [Punctularia strigosozonata HHB-11173 SS5]EIN10867.1 hypothetical protein PUNSTDRAFT_100714 [Punctularia strigosozonata HHB-11173 SS5]
MDSIIEIQRQTHEEIEHLEKTLYNILARPQPTHESRLQVEHKASQILDRITARGTTLHNVYEDQDSRKVEIDSLSGSGNADDLSAFYDRLKKVQEHYVKYPDAVPSGFELELAAFRDEPEEEQDADSAEEDPISLLFSGEESYGKFLDLYDNHTAYNNIKGIGKRIAYLQYLDVLMAVQERPLHDEISPEVRAGKDYEHYIKDLHSYLLSFTKRTRPLVDVEGQQSASALEFDEKWVAEDISGWKDQAKAAVDNGGEGIWCAACQKVYSKQTVYDAHLTSKKHVKATTKQATSEPPPSNPNGPASLTANGNGHVAPGKTRLRSIALLTHLCGSMIKELLLTFNDTKSNVERKFSLTAREREQELLEQAKSAPAPTKKGDTNPEGEEEEEEEERIYNPLKLPLGWDGKPIPYWLYKLHGLGVEYRCEICSDHVYMGRKNFERHFQESRHAFGMRALGLPNTKHFHEITRIEDALALAERLKREGRNEIFEQETMEELEDDDGNVYNRKTYEDLKKQGLI